jgi:(E)-4-hydroxy-3-methylbut-2-enyl-diphosphate synthase
MRSKKIFIGKTIIGNGAPIAVQSMLNVKTNNFRVAIKQIQNLQKAGCEIFRLAIPDQAAIIGLQKIRAKFPSLPLVADIHFDYRLAIAAAKVGADKIRINPGNLGSQENLQKVVEICQSKKIPIRIGVNAGSLEKKLRGKNLATQLVESAIRNVRAIEKLGYKNLVVSAKASEVKTTVLAYRKLAKILCYPLHLGITEAGSEKLGIIKSAAGIGSLLLDGIGDTIRISLTAKPEKEVIVAWDLLSALGLRRRGVEIIACPTCGRTEINLIALVKKIERALAKVQKPLKVAVMGCAVNGPGEARSADFALVGGKNKLALFQAGKFVKSVLPGKAVEELVKIMNDELVFAFKSKV